MKNEDIFSQEYISSGATSSGKIGQASPQDSGTQKEVLEKTSQEFVPNPIYGINKPKRTIRRATIASD
jgi:hypothetical protein